MFFFIMFLAGMVCTSNVDFPITCIFGPGLVIWDILQYEWDQICDFLLKSILILHYSHFSIVS